MVLLTSGITGCTKKEVIHSTEKETVHIPPPEPINRIEGIWTGSYTVEQSPDLGEQYYSMVLKPDGTLINETQGEGQLHIANGTWEMDGDKLICNTICIYGKYSNIGVRQLHTASFDRKSGKITNGEWKDLSSQGWGGSFTITKKTDK